MKYFRFYCPGLNKRERKKEGHKNEWTYLLGATTLSIKVLYVTLSITKLRIVLMLHAIMSSVVTLSVIMLNVGAPFNSKVLKQMTFQNNFLRLRRSLPGQLWQNRWQVRMAQRHLVKEKTRKMEIHPALLWGGLPWRFKQGTLTEGEGSVQLTSKLS